MFYNKILEKIYVYRNLYLWEVRLGLEMEPFGLYAIYICICIHIYKTYIIYKAKIINDALIQFFHLQESIVVIIKIKHIK